MWRHKVTLQFLSWEYLTLHLKINNSGGKHINQYRKEKLQANSESCPMMNQSCDGIRTFLEAWLLTTWRIWNTPMTSLYLPTAHQYTWHGQHWPKKPYLPLVTADHLPHVGWGRGGRLVADPWRHADTSCLKWSCAVSGVRGRGQAMGAQGSAITVN